MALSLLYGRSYGDMRCDCPIHYYRCLAPIPAEWGEKAGKDLATKIGGKIMTREEILREAERRGYEYEQKYRV